MTWAIQVASCRLGGGGDRREPAMRRTGLAERPSDGTAASHAGFGAMLRAYRERGLLSQEQLAERSRVSARAIGDLERGVRRPRGESVRLLADALGLVGWEREQFEAAARSLPPAGQPPASPCRTCPGPPSRTSCRRTLPISWVAPIGGRVSGWLAASQTVWRGRPRRLRWPSTRYPARRVWARARWRFTSPTSAPLTSRTGSFTRTCVARTWEACRRWTRARY